MKLKELKHNVYLEGYKNGHFDTVESSYLPDDSADDYIQYQFSSLMELLNEYSISKS